MDGSPGHALSVIVSGFRSALPDHTVHHRHPFVWVSPGTDQDRARYETLGAAAFSRVAQLLPDVTNAIPDGGWPVVVMRDVDDQMAYERLFQAPDDACGAQIIHGGCYRSWPAPHFAVSTAGGDNVDAALAHELVHACLEPRCVPLWIQEGIAMGVEFHLGLRQHPLGDAVSWRETIAWWRQADWSILWDGTAFGDPLSSKHAYDLCQVLAAPWFDRRREVIAQFVAATWDDEDAVLRTVLGRDRAGIRQQVVDPPRPSGWLERLLRRWVVQDDR